MSGELADPREAIFAALASGGPPISEGDPEGWGQRTWFHRSGEDGEGEVWLFHDRKTGLNRLDRELRAQDLPPAITDYQEKSDPAVAERRAARGRALADRLVGAMEALREGPWPERPWLRLREGRWMLWAEPVGDAFYSDSDRRGGLYARRDPSSEIATALYEEEGLAPSLPPEEARAAVDEVIEAVRAELAVLESDEQLLGHLDQERPGVILHRGGRLLRVHLDAEGRLDPSALFNPYAAVMEERRVVEWILDGLRRGGDGGEARRERIQPIPDALADDLAALDESFSLSKAEIIGRYIEKLRGGGYLSGGPTTDQSWTIEADGEGGFRIGGYEGEHPKLERVWRPIEEAKIREMIGSYHMFGLHRIKD